MATDLLPIDQPVLDRFDRDHPVDQSRDALRISATFFFEIFNRSTPFSGVFTYLNLMMKNISEIFR